MDLISIFELGFPVIGYDLLSGRAFSKALCYDPGRLFPPPIESPFRTKHKSRCRWKKLHRDGRLPFSSTSSYRWHLSRKFDCIKSSTGHCLNWIPKHLPETRVHVWTGRACTLPETVPQVYRKTKFCQSLCMSKEPLRHNPSIPGSIPSPAEGTMKSPAKERRLQCCKQWRPMATRSWLYSEFCVDTLMERPNKQKKKCKRAKQCQ